MKKILLVCTGNTCRSPMAEKILKQKIHERGIKDIKVSSAGLVVNVGQPMSENAIIALKSFKIRLSPHAAKQFTKKMIDDNDLIITMTAAHKNAIGNYKNVVSLAEYINGIDVPDPYEKDLQAYKKVAEYLIYAADEIIDKVSKKE